MRASTEAYTRDFGDRLWLAGETDTWKLERMQFYDETGFPSWDAFAAGNWDRSLELYEAMRTESRSFFGKYEERGSRPRLSSLEPLGHPVLELVG